ncbi:MAG: twin-arginine translocase TatA/TatE family subunit [Chlorobium sp.]|uniref:Sec-independent protein translocase protein TatA n=1 Tax=Chlorobium phaeobacteroides (strain BS1) TaxID=331678 RepID=TATA_CHLPB|nr:RecName: Full=Sec-independent protein translocase protein TatA [Chlorobium phaeobacteroides BS1]MBL6955965.1 twin-arginine translocase TatA/TatE family subunit [Chlorobium phaeobacteroides]MCW8796187.1 twin-arginine translocase TatA/TatE family subunit [Chlorobium sp.]MCW8818931.1 twin-arginine translocase TatA/TatE family subunit [Ignavibacteriaceae bacterium]NEX13825.1 twin-arginine translocase TatA/TatE family subunit [Prosthecochloris sp.]MCW8815177.1 twin-arginine translocase TatA/TatE
MFGLGGQELVLILLIILLLFGAKKLPELAKGLGKGMKEFKKAQSEIEEELNKAVDDTPEKEKKSSSEKS